MAGTDSVPRTLATFADVTGQERATRILSALVAQDRFPPLLLVGPAGTGKRTLALKLAQAANCQDQPSRPCGSCQSCRTIGLLRHVDLKVVFPIRLPKGVENQNPDRSIELVAEATTSRYGEFTLTQNQPEPDPTYTISIWQVRWLRREMARPPLLARHRFFIFLHANRMTDEAANALLKTLEEPGPRTSLVLTSDSPNQLLGTIRSRCRLVKLSPVPPKLIKEWAASRRDALPEDAALAAQFSDGSLGKAVRFLEDPESFLVPAAVRFFCHSRPEGHAILSTMSELRAVPPQTVVNTFLFLYRQTLRVKLGLGSDFARREPSVKSKAEVLSVDYLRRVIKHLSSRLEDCRMNLYRPLFLYTLLSSLRKPN